MNSYSQRHRIWLKAIAVVVVCLLPVNSISWALGGNGRTLNRDTLATQSIFKPLIDAGIEDTAELVFEIITGMRLLLAGKTPAAVNGILTETYKDSEDRRKIEFLQDVEKDVSGIKAKFEIVGRKDLKFEVRYQDTETEPVTEKDRKAGDDIDVKDAHLNEVVPMNRLTYGNIFQMNDAITITRLESDLPLMRYYVTETISEIPENSKEIEENGETLYISPNAQEGLKKLDDFVRESDIVSEVTGFGLIKQYEHDENISVVIDFVPPRKDKVFNVGKGRWREDRWSKQLLKTLAQSKELVLTVENGELQLVSDNEEHTMLVDGNRWSYVWEYVNRLTSRELVFEVEKVKDIVKETGAVVLDTDFDVIVNGTTAWQTQVYHDRAFEEAKKQKAALDYGAHHHPVFPDDIDEYTNRSVEDRRRFYSRRLRFSGSDLRHASGINAKWFEIRAKGTPEDMLSETETTSRYYNMERIDAVLSPMKEVIDELLDMPVEEGTPERLNDLIQRLLKMLSDLPGIDTDLQTALIYFYGADKIEEIGTRLRLPRDVTSLVDFVVQEIFRDGGNITKFGDIDILEVLRVHKQCETHDIFRRLMHYHDSRPELKENISEFLSACWLWGLPTETDIERIQQSVSFCKEFAQSLDIDILSDPEPEEPQTPGFPDVLNPDSILQEITGRPLDEGLAIVAGREQMAMEEIDRLLDKAKPDPDFIKPINSREDLLDYFKNGKLVKEGLRLVKAVLAQPDISEISQLADLMEERVSSTEVALLPLLERVPRALFLNGISSVHRITKEGIEFRYKSQVELVPFAENIRPLMNELLLEAEREYAPVGFTERIWEKFTANCDIRALARYGLVWVEEICEEKEVLDNVRANIEDGTPGVRMVYIYGIISLLSYFPNMLLERLPRDRWSFTFSTENNILGVRFFNHINGENEFVPFASQEETNDILAPEQYSTIMGLFDMVSNVPSARLLNEFDRIVLESGSDLSQFDKARNIFREKHGAQVPLSYSSSNAYISVAEARGKDYEDIITRKLSLSELNLISDILDILPEDLITGTEYYTFRPRTVMGIAVVAADTSEQARKMVLVPNLFEFPEEVKKEFYEVLYKGHRGDISPLVKDYLDGLSLTPDEFEILYWLRVVLHEQGHSVEDNKLPQELIQEFYSYSWEEDGKMRTEAEGNQEDHFVLKTTEREFTYSEDFADCFAAYVLFGPQFKSEARARPGSALAKKYEFLRQHVFNGVEYDDNPDFRTFYEAYTRSKIETAPSRVTFLSGFFDTLGKVKRNEYFATDKLEADVRALRATMPRAIDAEKGLEKPSPDEMHGVSRDEEKRLFREMNDEEYLLTKTARHLKGFPVNMHIDISAIPKREEQLGENMETLARLIIWHNTYGLDVRYILRNDTDGLALNILKEKLRELGDMPGLDVNELLASIGPAHTGDKVIDVRLEKWASIGDNRIIKDREYFVALKEDHTKEGVSIPNYTAASSIGLSLAALRVARDKGAKDYENMRDKVLKTFRSIYARHEVIESEDDFTVDELELMVTGSSATKLYYTMLYALPPVVKMSIEKIGEYHEKMQLILQAA